ncbi:MAG: hypothetical protein D3922_02555 [Candidatus Electrothrix sp. AR1]|nr:hypothetical protein [Candidatus Electrothrix sp. AR1]
MLLAAEEEVFGAGELTFLPKDGFVDDAPCSCGCSVSRCQVWSQVKKRLDLSDKKYNKWCDLQKEVDWHTGFFKQLLHRVTRVDFNTYKEVNCKLLKFISEITGCRVVVDTSKYSGRALALHRILHGKVKVICLTRSPTGLMNSFQKKGNEQASKTPLQTMVYYIGSLTLLRMACSRLRGDIFYMRYEDLIADPLKSLEMVESWSGLDLTESKQRVEQKIPFEIGHVVTGNRLRKKGQVVFIRGSVNAATTEWEKILLLIMNGWKWLLRF